MSVRVGRCIFTGAKRIDPSFENYTLIIVLTPSTEYGDLSPYVLKDERGRLMENIWQFSKVYESVPKTVCRYSRWDDTVIWNYPAEKHVDKDGNILSNYWNWRKKGMNAVYPIRYPVGFQNRHTVLYSLKHRDGEKLDYITARKKIYMPTYIKLVKKQQRFIELQERVKNGENLLIVDVDGPHQESLNYYKEKYNVTDDFIEKDSVLVTRENMEIFLNDEKYPFGHGYCLGLALLGIKI